MSRARLAARMILIITWPLTRLERLSIRWPVAACAVLMFGGLSVGTLIPNPFGPATHMFVGGLTLFILINAHRARVSAARQPLAGTENKEVKEGSSAVAYTLTVHSTGDEMVFVQTHHHPEHLTSRRLAALLYQLARETAADDIRDKAGLN